MKIFFLLLLVFIFNTYGGTGVGSPFVQQLPEFDYQMAFPSTWKVSNKSVTGSEGLFVRWGADNSTIVAENQKSEIVIEFLADFPATSLSGLYDEIGKRHSEFDFDNSANKHIQGWTSTLVQNGEYLENWEYYFIAPRRVVRIHTLRRDEGFGVSHIEIILRSIRKISSGIQITKARFKNTSRDINSASVGDKVCYEFSFDYPKEMQSETMISSFKTLYEKENEDFPIDKKILKQRSYSENTGIHKVCFEIVAGMSKYDHIIESMEYEVEGSFLGKTCEYSLKNLVCGEESIKLEIPALDIKNSDKEGPEISSLTFESIENRLKMKVTDANQVKLIQIFLNGEDDSDQNLVAVIFPDQIVDGNVNFKFLRKYNPSTYINAIYFTDSSGNTSALIRSESASIKYLFKQLGQAPIETNFPVIGW